MFEEILALLLPCADKKYQAFQASLIPNLSDNTILGVRMPVLRHIAKKLNLNQIRWLLEQKNPELYEIRILQILCMNALNSERKSLEWLRQHAGSFSSWAETDIVAPKSFSKASAAFQKEVMEQIEQWLQDSHPYTVRLGILLLMKYFLKQEPWLERSIELVLQADSDSYYISMAAAWFFCEAYIQYPQINPYWYQDPRIHENTKKRSLQKCRDSRRLTLEQKQYASSL